MEGTLQNIVKTVQKSFDVWATWKMAKISKSKAVVRRVPR